MNRSFNLAALLGTMQQQKAALEQQMQLVSQLLAQSQTTSTQTQTISTNGQVRKRRMSAAGRKAISEATKKRWAQWHAAKAKAAAKGRATSRKPKTTARKTVKAA